MELKYANKYQSLKKMDILAQSITESIVLPEQGHYSKRKKQSMSPKSKQPQSKKVQLMQPENEEQRIIEEISRLNRIIRFKSQLLRKKYEVTDSPQQSKAQDNKLDNKQQQIFLRYESNYSPKAFQQLASAIRKQQQSTEFIAGCFPQIISVAGVEVLPPVRKRLNIERLMKYRSNEIKQEFLNRGVSQPSRVKSQAKLSMKEKQRKNKSELINKWEDTLQELVKQQNGSNVFLYILSSSHPTFIGYISYSLGVDKLEKGEYSISLDRVYIIQPFRSSSQQQLVSNLFKTLIGSLSQGQVNKPLKAYWMVKHQLLSKAQRWGWRMVAYRRKHYILVFG